jgi:hypothetical protein
MLWQVLGISAWIAILAFFVLLALLIVLYFKYKLPSKAGNTSRQLRFEVETTSDWTEVNFGNGLGLLGELSESIVFGEVNFTDKKKDHYHINKSGSAGKPTKVTIIGTFDIHRSNPVVMLRKGDIGRTVLSVTDGKDLIAKAENTISGRFTNDLEVTLELRV